MTHNYNTKAHIITRFSFEIPKMCAVPDSCLQTITDSSQHIAIPQGKTLFWFTAHHSCTQSLLSDPSLQQQRKPMVKTSRVRFLSHTVRILHLIPSVALALGNNIKESVVLTVGCPELELLICHRL